MNRLQILHTLLRREQDRRDVALTEWRESQRAVELAQQQAESLVAYRAEYRERWAAQFARSAPIEIIRYYQGFVERLEQAIVAQQHSARMAEERQLAARARLQKREIKVATVRKLIERRLLAAELAVQRRDQKISDEASQRLVWAARQHLASV
ncbi:MAG TPA: flagellar export protein FliJ [Ideonella sp.]|nr:flagellar export protein FliJ [Ideonella sp.]